MAMMIRPVTMKMKMRIMKNHFGNENDNHLNRVLNPSCVVSVEKLVGEFNPKIPIQKAKTPPSTWYTDPTFYALELEHVFYRGWQAVGWFFLFTFLFYFYIIKPSNHNI